MTATTQTPVIPFKDCDNADNSNITTPSPYVKSLPPQGMSRASKILPFLPFGRTTLHEWSKDGRFPASVKLSPTMVAWRNADVLAWLDSQDNNDQVEGV